MMGSTTARASVAAHVAAYHASRALVGGPAARARSAALFRMCRATGSGRLAVPVRGTTRPGALSLLNLLLHLLLNRV